MPTAKEYRRLSREDDKHRVLFRGMAKWKAAQERGEDLPVGDFTAVNLEDVVPGRREPSAFSALQVIADLPTGRNLDVMEGQEQAYRAVESLFDVPPRIVCHASHRTESIGYLQDNFVTNCDIHGAVIGQCKQCFKLSDDE